MPKFFLFFSFLLMVLVGWWSIKNLDISENIDSAIPNTEAFKQIKPILDKGNRSIVFSISINPSTDTPNSIKEKADSLIVLLSKNTGLHIEDLQYKSDIDPDTFGQYLFNNLYLFLDSSDYQKIEKNLIADKITEEMIKNKSSLYTPEGLAVKDWTIRDPLHFMRFAYTKLQQDIVSNAFIENEGLFISHDKNKLFIYGSLKYNPSESQNNKILAEKLAITKENWNKKTPDNKLDYFGTFLIANANANQITSDLKITISIAILFILSILIYYYRDFRIIIFFLLPGVFGLIFAFIGIYVLQQHISGIALGAGAVVLGIIVDYSFHFFSQFKQTNNAYETRKQILLPLLVSGSTTIIAFLSLTFAKSEVLHDFGLFTAFSLIGALFFVLVFLPSILHSSKNRIHLSHTNKLDTWFDKISLGPVYRSKWPMFLIVIATIIFSYFAVNIKFESDINNLNFYPDDLKKAEIEHQDINPDKEKRVYFLSLGDNTNEVLANNSNLYKVLSSRRDTFKIKQINSLGLFILSDKDQESKINMWTSFWNDKHEVVWNQVNQIADSLGFKNSVFSPFRDYLATQPVKKDLTKFVLESKLLSQLLIPNEPNNDSNYSLITSLVLPKQQYPAFKNQIEANETVILVDGASLMGKLTEAVKDDFNYLLIFVSILVFGAMLLIYGSIELTLISFIPIVISWIWILGISALLDFKFNFVNIVIVTFIFGLGDDFAIFITDGLQTKYKYGRKVLGHYKASIILSSISTIIGTGVLIFAKHPVLKSIAAISVTGIIIIVFISFFVQPAIFNFFITRRTINNKPPVTIRSILISFIGYSVFIAGSLLGVFFGLVIRLIPFKNVAWKKHQLHRMLKWISGTMLDILFTTTKRYYNMQNLDFSKPSIIIANHTSFFDILALARLHPNVIMLVNKWVYDSVLFGNAIRYADYVPTFNSLDNNIEKVKELISHGYSIVIFPEGSRSPDGKIKRFHKGAFFLAEKLKLDITPIVLHGFSYTMPKYDYNLKDSYLSTYVLPRIKYDDPNYGIGYRERTKSISKYFKESYKEVNDICGSLDYQYYPLLYSYKYKGPILEWYFRIKWKFEKHNYENYYSRIGKGSKRVYDLGCGFGFLSYYLKLRNDLFDIAGYDYDEDKIAVAQNSYLKRDGIEFSTADITSVIPVNADVIIIADTLHYLSSDEQIKVLNQSREGLNKGGMILIRDGLEEKSKKHAWTKKSELWSTKYLGFNKAKSKLNFFNKSFIEDWASQHNLSFELHLQNSKSSNALIILTSK